MRGGSQTLTSGSSLVMQTTPGGRLVAEDAERLACLDGHWV